TEARVHIDRALIAYEDKNFDAAQQELLEALKLEPDNAEALYYQGLVYTSLKRPDDARRVFERARAQRPENNDIAFELGTLYFAQEAYDQAEAPLRQVFRSEPSKPNLGYYLGFIEYRKQNYRQALRFFEANVPSDTDYAQLNKFYSGLAMSSLGFPREARTQIEEALQLQPISPLSVPGQRFGEILRTAEQREKLFNGELRLGIFYDTNVPVVPASSSDIVAQAIQQEQRRRKSGGELASVNLAYTWLRKLDWEGTVSYRFLQTYNNHLTEFNTQDHTPSVGLAYRSSLQGMPLIVGSQLSYDFITLGNSRFSQRWILNPYVNLVESQNATVSNSTTLQFRFQAKDFFSDHDVTRREVRDALNYMVGPIHFVLFEEGRHYLKFGYQYDYDQAEGEDWTYSGNRLLAGGQYTLPWWDLRLRYDVDVQWRAYKYKNSLIPATAPGTVKQRVTEPVHLVSISKDFRWFSGSENNFTGAIEYLFDNNRSNLAPYTYKRHVVTTSIAWRF
ncbi:MAG: tetratricopeptide repeat protein, partial [Candidatus Binatia bacterium]